MRGGAPNAPNNLHVGRAAPLPQAPHLCHKRPRQKENTPNQSRPCRAGLGRAGSTYDSPVCCQSVAHVGNVVNVGHVGLICQTVRMFQSCGSKTVKAGQSLKLKMLGRLGCASASAASEAASGRQSVTVCWSLFVSCPCPLVTGSARRGMWRAA